MIRSRLLLLATALLAGLATTSCSRLGTVEKMGVISLTAGTAGTVMAYQNSASAAASVGGGLAAGLIPATGALITDEVEATPG